jgi:hypothetical protein
MERVSPISLDIASHFRLAHRQRLSRSFTVTGLPWTGRSWRLRLTSLRRPP